MLLEKIAILGDGGWGTAIALLLAEKGAIVKIWGYDPQYIDEMKESRENRKFLPGFNLPENIKLCDKIDTCLEGADIIICAVPTQFLRQTLSKVKSGTKFPKSSIFCSVSKGVEKNTMKRPSEIIRETLGIENISVLSGPSHAEEVAKHLPATVVVASDNIKNAERLQSVFMTSTFRVYTSQDIISVELGGALKNVIAVSVGICEGLGLGDNARAALMTRGLAEMVRLCEFMGGSKETMNGLSGIGDLITTCVSPFGRNRSVGLLLAEGKSLKDITTSTEQVAEGVHTCESVYNIAVKNNIEMPITEALYKVLYKGKPPLEAVSELMSRTPKSEY